MDDQPCHWFPTHQTSYTLSRSPLNSACLGWFGVYGKRRLCMELYFLLTYIYVFILLGGWKYSTDYYLKRRSRNPGGIPGFCCCHPSLLWGLVQVNGLRQRALGSWYLIAEVLQKYGSVCRSKNVEILCHVLT